MADAEPGQPAALADDARLWFIASLPPPVDGQKVCNEAMLTRLSVCTRPVRLALGRTAASKVARAIANTWTLLRRACAGDIAYVSVPGQMGVWMLLPVVAALRLRGVPIWLHHHSFRPINCGPQRAMRALVACSGPRQCHILLSDGMRDRFAAMYLTYGHGRAFTLSNTCLFPPDTCTGLDERPARPPTLGHMSVLTRAKGVFYLLELFDELVRHVPGIRLVLAGPVRDPELDRAIAAAALRHPQAFDYRGAVHGEEKVRFYQDIDLFVLPTTLVDEAEPLVMIEAYASGVDVLATATGCIPDRLRAGDRRLVLDRAMDLDALRRAAGATQVEWAALRDACRAHVVRLTQTSARQGEDMLARMFNSASAGAKSVMRAEIK